MGQGADDDPQVERDDDATRMVECEFVDGGSRGRRLRWTNAPAGDRELDAPALRSLALELLDRAEALDRRRSVPPERR